MQALIISQNAMKSADLDAIHLNHFLPKWSESLHFPLEVTLILNQPLKKKIDGVNIIIAPSLTELKKIISNWSQQQFLNDKTPVKLKWFSYHGHGFTGIRGPSDSDYRESDNSHEYIRWGNEVFVDHEIRNCLFNSCSFPVSFLCLMDCCSSGTMLDLPLVENYTQKTWTTENTWKITNDVKIVSLSACSDNQYDMDDLSDEGYGGGLLSAWFDSFRTPLGWNDRIENIRTRLKLLNQSFTLSVAHDSDMIELSKLIDPNVLSKDDTLFTFSLDSFPDEKKSTVIDRKYTSQTVIPIIEESFEMKFLNIPKPFKNDELDFSPRQLNASSTLLLDNSKEMDRKSRETTPNLDKPSNLSRISSASGISEKTRASEKCKNKFSFIIIYIILICILVIFIYVFAVYFSSTFITSYKKRTPLHNQLLNSY